MVALYLEWNIGYIAHGTNMLSVNNFNITSVFYHILFEKINLIPQCKIAYEEEL